MALDIIYLFLSHPKSTYNIVLGPGSASVQGILLRVHLYLPTGPEMKSSIRNRHHFAPPPPSTGAHQHGGVCVPRWSVPVVERNIIYF